MNHPTITTIASLAVESAETMFWNLGLVMAAALVLGVAWPLWHNRR